MSQFTYINPNASKASGFKSLELADINLRTHTAIENRPNIELSLTLHNWGESPLVFSHNSLDIQDAGIYKFIHIDYIKNPKTKLNYTKKQEEPIVFFERYETETFEEKTFLIPGISFRDDDVPDLI